ncbi:MULTISPECIES: hypothetical protein [unclassified Paenibacillus]|uniref:hypothetical protein n=1 Tax=unclassified Paenibacillus TaxID=185978 RepID=UPI0015C36D97|nr:hypothetical protein [Paenibacillus sp. FSL H8-0259]
MLRRAFCGDDPGVGGVFCGDDSTVAGRSAVMIRVLAGRSNSAFPTPAPFSL